MTKNNALPPASQPWVRELEKRIKDLENKSYRTDSKVNVMSNRVMSPKVDLDALSVTEIRVGGEEPQVFEHEVQNYSINGNTITASTPPVPVQRGFIMEWEVDVTASVDYIQVSSSLDPEMYVDPEEPTGALAGEETTYFADASYMTEMVDAEDEMFNPVPPIVSFTLHNPAKTEFTFTVHAVRMRFIIPGEGGLRITQDGEIYFEDGAGHDRIIQEITEEQAQAIVETADNLAQAQQDLEAARAEAEQNFEELDDKLGQAFPGDNIFDVDLAIEQAKELAEQKFNDSITGTLVEYALNANETAPPITGWSTTPPTRTPGTFIWMRTTVSYGSGDTTTSDPVLLTGNAGAQGPQGPEGPQGPQGVRGPDGPQGQAFYTWIKYAPNGNPTSEQMSESPVGMTYMGIAHNQTTQTEGTDPTAYSWSLIKGPQGDTGIPGPEGADGQSLYTWVKYAPNGSPTAGQITDTPQATSTHIGLAYNKTTASESTVPSDYTWTLIQGPQGPKGEEGDEGEQGVSVSSITPHFRRLAESAAKPAKPSGMTPSGWVSEEPEYARDTTVWRSDRIVFSNGQITWTDVSKLSSYEAAKAAEAAALAYADQKKQEAIDAGAHDLANLEIGGRNLIVISALDRTGYLLETGAFQAYAGWATTDFIPALPNTHYVHSGFSSLGSNPSTVYYDANKNFISGIKGSPRENITTPPGTAFIRTSMLIADLGRIKLERGTKATDWTPAPEDVDAGIAEAQAKADSAYSFAVDVEDIALNASTQATTAMTTANGKNRVTYTDVADSVAEPGPTPAKSLGDGRPKYDMHRNRRTSNGVVIGEWIWTGTAWTRLQLSDGMLTSLDVGKLTAGTTDIQTAVIQKLWVDGLVGRTATFSRLTLAAQNMIPGIETMSTWGGISVEERDTLPLREFGINTSDPSLWLQGKQTKWIWAQIPVTAGERYRWSVDVKGSVAGTVFFIQTSLANNDGSRGEAFSSWTDWRSSPNVNYSAGSYPFQNTVAGTGYQTYWAEATATASGVISLYIFANHGNGTTNESGYQWFRNLRMRAMTDGNMLVDGAVTSRTLNIVPESGTGGVEILPPGIRIIPSGEGAGTAVSLRVGEDNVISFAKNNENTFSVDESGNITGESLDVRDSLKVDGVPIEEMFKAPPQGYLARGAMSGTSVYVGTEAGRIVMASFRTPAENRLMKVTVSLRPNANAERHAEIAIRQSEGLDVKVTNSDKKIWPVIIPKATAWEASQVFTVEEWGWPLDATITLGVFAKSITANQTIQFVATHGQTITIEDVGPPLELQTNDAYVPTSTGGGSGGSGSETDKGKRYHDGKFYPTLTRSFKGDGSQYTWNENMLFHGYNLSANGQLRSMAIFNRTAVNALTTGDGTEMVSGYIKLYNSHTWANSGMTVRVGYVKSYTSLPGTWNGTTNFTLIGSYKVSRGGVLTIPLTSTLLSQIKNGGFRGVALVSNTNTASHYGYFNAGKTELYIKVRK